MSDQGITYMGLFDDRTALYPWRFKVEQRMLDHLLLTEVIHGRPILLNDGYLVQHEYLQESIVTERGLAWALLGTDFVKVMNRGHPLPSMVEQMAAQRLTSFQQLVTGATKVGDWKPFRARLEKLDGHLQRNGQYVGWPPYHSGSGYALLAKRLLDRGATPHALGIGRVVSRHAFSEFLKLFCAQMEVNIDKPRTHWEALAKACADNPGFTREPAQFRRALMNLANELYHYNMGLMLAANGFDSVAVQTQTSPAFDDLLFPPAMKVLVSDVTNAPRLHVPRSIASVEPSHLLDILRPETRVHQTRAGWIQLRAAWEAATTPDRRKSVEKELKIAADEYGAELTRLLGAHVRYREPEAFIEYAIDTAAPVLGTLVAGVPGGLAGFGIGYGLSRLKDRVAGGIIRKFRVELLGKELAIPPALADYSKRVLNVIKRRALPSTVELQPDLARVFAKQLLRI